MSKPIKNTKEKSKRLEKDEEDDVLDSIDLDFFELFEVLNAKEIVKLLNAVGGKFTSEDGNMIKKLVSFLNELDDDKLDDLLDAFDEVMKGK